MSSRQKVGLTALLLDNKPIKSILINTIKDFTIPCGR